VVARPPGSVQVLFCRYAAGHALDPGEAGSGHQEPAAARDTLVFEGTDVALESADMVLMRSDLRAVPQALLLAKKTFRIIRQNLFWAFFYNIVAIPLAIAGMLHPIVAAGAMALSSLSVVVNSLRARI